MDGGDRGNELFEAVLVVEVRGLVDEVHHQCPCGVAGAVQLGQHLLGVEELVGEDFSEVGGLVAVAFE